MDRLVAVVSLVNYAADNQPLQLLQDPERAAGHAATELIRSRVSNRLPSCMLPTVWIAVAALPQLASGKLDRKRVMQWLLDMPEGLYHRAISTGEASHSTNGPTTHIEETLRSIWAHVLNLPQEQVALDRSFLSISGDSISAMQVRNASGT